MCSTVCLFGFSRFKLKLNLSFKILQAMCIIRLWFLQSQLLCSYRFAQTSVLKTGGLWSATGSQGGLQLCFV